MVTLYVDGDFGYPVVQRLRQLGHDMLTAQEAGQAGQGIEDAAVLAFATAAGRAVLTFNRRHFIRSTLQYRRTPVSLCVPVTMILELWLTVSISSSRVPRYFRISCYASTVSQFVKR